ncbi:MAG: DUF1425 domain-containing protein [Phycisphaerales bacterium]|nr:DUF1425 domain-containing protein [Phycisphaerales bacterium]
MNRLTANSTDYPLRTKVSATAVLFCSVATTSMLLLACGSTNTTYTRTSPADSAVETRLQMNDILTQVFLHCREVREFRTPGGPMEVQVDADNDGFSQRNFAYKFTWLDPQGNVIESPMSVWKSASVASGARITIRSLAPTDSATDFRLEVRRSD